jgi:hypothetical protein
LYRLCQHQLPPSFVTVPQARIQAAQYAHLPLAAIGPDWIIDAADAVFARQLRECWGENANGLRSAEGG